jgi:DNA-binding SARP family transcriptional activator
VAAAGSSTIELLLFGAPTLWRTDTGSTAKLRLQIRQALAIIVLEGDANFAIPESLLIEHLWGAKPQVQGNLDGLVSEIRHKILEEGLGADDHHLQRRDGIVQLVDITVDTREFDLARNAGDVTRALKIAERGRLLEGLRPGQIESFEWAERARRRYGTHVIRCYQQIANDVAKDINAGTGHIAQLIEIVEEQERKARGYELTSEANDLQGSLDRLRELEKSPIELAPSPATRQAGHVPNTPSLDRLLVSRLGSGLSLRVDPDHVDTTHRYIHVVRHDLLDYPSGDFYSLRRLCGINASRKPSASLVYAESSETKLTFEQTATRAYDTGTRKPLVVEPLLPANVPLYQHGFRIFFSHPLAPNEAFDITYAIRLPGELAILSPIEEIMSIALVRWPQGVERLDFKVCLNFEPLNVSAEYLSDNGKLATLDVPPTLDRYSPTEWYERDLDIPWSSDPYVISYAVEHPTAPMYAIRYRV